MYQRRRPFQQKCTYISCHENIPQPSGTQIHFKTNAEMKTHKTDLTHSINKLCLLMLIARHSDNPFNFISNIKLVSLVGMLNLQNGPKHCFARVWIQLPCAAHARRGQLHIKKTTFFYSSDPLCLHPAYAESLKLSPDAFNSLLLFSSLKLAFSSCRPPSIAHTTIPLASASPAHFLTSHLTYSAKQ